MYSQALLDGSSQPMTSMRRLKVGVSLFGGFCFGFLFIVALTSIYTPSLHSTSAAESTNLVSRFSQIGTQPRPMLPKTMNNLLGGPSPWKDLAVAAIQANQIRDVSMKAGTMKEATSSMDKKTKQDMEKVSSEVMQKAREMTGVTEPMGFWDPLGFITPGTSEGKLLFYREVELKHGRVAMLATLGFLVGEAYHPLFGGNLDVAGVKAFQETSLDNFWKLIAIAIAIPEIGTITSGDFKWWNMKEGREPGLYPSEVWDPLKLRPKFEERGNFRDIQTREINNGRLAMIGAAGMIAQELVNGQKVVPTANSFFSGLWEGLFAKAVR